MQSRLRAAASCKQLPEEVEEEPSAEAPTPEKVAKLESMMPRPRWRGRPVPNANRRMWLVIAEWPRPPAKLEELLEKACRTEGTVGCGEGGAIADRSKLQA